MKFPAFEMERMQSVWEHKVKYDLSESGVEPLTLEEAARDVKELLKTKLGYAEGVGLESTRTFVSEFHWKSTAENVVITTGTSEANFLTLLALVNAGDEVVVVMPNYMQVHGVAQGLGARVREVWLREERGSPTSRSRDGRSASSARASLGTNVGRRSRIGRQGARASCTGRRRSRARSASSPIAIRSTRCPLSTGSSATTRR